MYVAPEESSEAPFLEHPDDLCSGGRCLRADFSPPGVSLPGRLQPQHDRFSSDGGVFRRRLHAGLYGHHLCAGLCDSAVWQHLFIGAGFMAQPGFHHLACLGYLHDDVLICPGGPGLDGPERFWAGSIFLTWTVIILLIASVMVLAHLVQRLMIHRVTGMLNFVSQKGRQVIDAVYPSLTAEPTRQRLEKSPNAHMPTPPVTQTVNHTGPPMVIAAYNVSVLVSRARQAGGVIIM